MKFDDYDTFLFKHPYISVFTVNMAPIFSDLLGRFVSLIENLFGTAQKTDSAVKSILEENSTTTQSKPLASSRVQPTPPATTTIPASTVISTTTNSKPRTSVDDDNDVENIDQPQPEASFEDPYNLYSSFAEALKSDPAKVRKTLIEKGNQLLESIKELIPDEEESSFYRAKYRFPLWTYETWEDSRNYLKQNLERGRGTLPKDNIQETEKRIEEADETIRVLKKEHKSRIFTNAICKWYHACSEDEKMDLNSKLIDVYNKEGFKNFTSFAPTAVKCFESGLLPKVDNVGALEALALTHDVTIVLHDGSENSTLGLGEKQVHIYKYGDRYSSNPLP